LSLHSLRVATITFGTAEEIRSKRLLETHDTQPEHTCRETKPGTCDVGYVKHTQYAFCENTWDTACRDVWRSQHRWAKPCRHESFKYEWHASTECVSREIPSDTRLHAPYPILQPPAVPCLAEIRGPYNFATVYATYKPLCPAQRGGEVTMATHRRRPLADK